MAPPTQSAAALDAMLKEHALLREEIKDRLNTAFSHVAYAGAIAAFAIPASDKVAPWMPPWVPLVCALVGLAALCWVAVLNMRWVQHVGAYLQQIEHRVNQRLGEQALGWEHYAETVRARMWCLIPAPPQAGRSAKAKVSTLVRIAIVVGALAVLGALASCATPSSSQVPPQTEAPRKLVIFFDGTANDETSDTNLKKLHSLVSLQNRPDMSTLYIEGVGAQGKFIGMATAWGAGHRVRLAYSYLLKEYRPGDSIYLFGFSRGAYSARILAAMLYYAGLPGVNPVTDPGFVPDLYDAYKGPGPDRRARIAQFLSGRKLPGPRPVRIKVLGLWDTVEAHGIPDYKEGVDEFNDRYGDQLCNIDKGLHALSLDDDRARIFTPILLTRPHLLNDCTDLKDALASPAAKARYLDETVEEVWFAGAHSDVGGGYRDTLLSGVSLNWMIRQLRLNQADLLPASTMVKEDVFGRSHDPESGVWGLIYHKQSRNLSQYAQANNTLYNGRKLKVHASVVWRLTQCKEETCQHQAHEYPWVQKDGGGACFQEALGQLVYTGEKNEACFLSVVEQ